MIKTPKKFEVYLVNLDPTIGREINKTRPCVIVSPEYMNRFETVIVVPLTSKSKAYMPWRVESDFKDIKGDFATDQIRTISVQRLVKKLGALDEETSKSLAGKLIEIFEYEYQA